MAFDIKVKNLTWKDVKLVCPCGGNPNYKYHFELKQVGGLVMYKCLNEECENSFSSEIQLKAMQKLEEWLEKKGTPEGFVHYFRTKDNRMRLRYLRTEQITSSHSCYVIEIANMTIMPSELLSSKNT